MENFTEKIIKLIEVFPKNTSVQKVVIESVKSNVAKALHQEGMYSDKEVRELLVRLKMDVIEKHQAQITNLDVIEWYNQYEKF